MRRAGWTWRPLLVSAAVLGVSSILEGAELKIPEGLAKWREGLNLAWTGTLPTRRLLRDEKFTESEAALVKLKKENDDHPQIEYLIGWTHCFAKRDGLAQQSFQKVIDVRDTRPTYVLAWSYISLGQIRDIAGDRFAKLLDDPRSARMLGDADVEHGVACVLHDEEDVEHAERRRRHGEEVHRGEDLAVVTKEVAPPLPRFRIGGTPWHDSGDRALGNVEAGDEKFAVNARRTPGRYA